MSDGLFFMQRYWGSDEEEECSENHDDILPNKFDKIMTNNKKRKFSSLIKDEIKEEITTACESEKILNSKKKIKQKVAKKNLDGTSIIKKSNVIKTEQGSLTNLKFHESDDLKYNTNSDIIKIKYTHDESFSNDNADKLNQLDEEQREIFLPIGQVKHINANKIPMILPKWLNNPTRISIDLHEQKTSIFELEYLDDTSKKNLKDNGINYLFPVQLKVIPWLITNNQKSLTIHPSDLCVSAPTGSGKTLAFVLPIVQSLKDRVVCAVRALIVLPVSEIAIQVYKVFQTFMKGTDLKITLLTGQKSFLNEQCSLVKKSVTKIHSLVDIIVTTPDRVLDHLHKTEGFSLEKLRYLVIDEADRMMDDIQKGWLKHIESAVFSNQMHTSCKCFAPNTKRLPYYSLSACDFSCTRLPLQKLLYSATLSHDPEKLHTLSLYKPKLFTTYNQQQEWVGKCSIPQALQMQFIISADDTKPIILCHYIKTENFKKVLCFTESVQRSHRLCLILSEMGGLQVREISSNKAPVQRKIILEQFASGKVNVLICSDLVARGIDIEDIDCVVSYDAPPFVKTYVHRIGRTARAGKTGTAVTLISETDLPKFKKMLISAGIPIPVQKKIDVKCLDEYVASFQRALQLANEKLKKMNRIRSNRKK